MESRKNVQVHTLHTYIHTYIHTFEQLWKVGKTFQGVWDTLFPGSVDWELGWEAHVKVCVYACVCMRACVCMYVRMYVCMWDLLSLANVVWGLGWEAHVKVCVHACLCMCTCVCMYVRMYVCMWDLVLPMGGSCQGMYMHVFIMHPCEYV